MVAADAYRVELGHMLTGISEDIGDNPHTGLWRVNIGVADHELLENIILDGAA